MKREYIVAYEEAYADGVYFAHPIGELGQELVRCKECIWRGRDNQGEDYCTYAKGLADINESSFCSWGEREDE